MLNASLVSYSDTEESDEREGILVKPQKKQTKRRKSRSEPCTPVSIRSIPLPGEKISSSSHPGEKISSIPLPGEKGGLESRGLSASSASKPKKKYASKALYIPPPLKRCPRSADSNAVSGDSGWNSKARISYMTQDDTPKRPIKTSSIGEKGGICVNRKRIHRAELLCSDAEEVKTKLVKTEESVPDKHPVCVEPQKVTLKPFWYGRPPPNNVSLSAQPASLPYDANVLQRTPTGKHGRYVIEQSGHSSMPDLSNMPSLTLESPTPTLCSLSDVRSCADVSTVTSLSPVNADLTQSEPGPTRRGSARRRYSHEYTGGSHSRTHIKPAQPRLCRRVFENSSRNSTPELSTRSIWNGWKSNFQKKYFGFQEEFIDTHCHLDFLYNREGFEGSFQKYKVVHEETFPANFGGCVAVFCEPHSFKPRGGLWKSISLEPDVWVAMGCHPKCAMDYTNWTEDALTACLRHHKVIAAGEFGLDYSGRFKENADHQKDVFTRQLKIAMAQDKPLVIHCRNAEDDTFHILKKYVPKYAKIHRHCFTLGFDEAERWIDTFPNLYIGLTPLVTYHSALPTHDVAKKLPLERLLLETDSPYFVPHEVPRSQMSFSHPGMAITVAEQVARFREIPVSEVLEATRENTRKMYGI